MIPQATVRQLIYNLRRRVVLMVAMKHHFQDLDRNMAQSTYRHHWRLSRTIIRFLPPRLCLSTRHLHLYQIYLIRKIHLIYLTQYVPK